jgi:hypothetical protein
LSNRLYPPNTKSLCIRQDYCVIRFVVLYRLIMKQRSSHNTKPSDSTFSGLLKPGSCLYSLYQVFMYDHSSVICQTTGPQPLPKRFLHLMRSRASSFKVEYPLLSPRSSSNFLRLLPRLLVTSIRPFIYPSITAFRRQFLRKIYLSIYLQVFTSVFSLRIEVVYKDG